MSPAPGFNPESDLVYVTGTFAGFWPEPGIDPDNQLMTRVGETMIWTKTFYLEEGNYEHKYFLNNGWDNGEWAGCHCACSNLFPAFTQRMPAFKHSVHFCLYKVVY